MIVEKGLVYKGRLGANIDLDLVTQEGYYIQPISNNNGASSGTNYPVALAGVLTVINRTFKFQEYRTYDNSSIYYRTWYSSTGWYPWIKVNTNEDSGWIDFSFINDYSNDSKNGQNSCQYRKIGNRVFLKGLVYSGGSTNREIAKLPEGFYNPNWKNNIYLVAALNGNECKNVQVSKGGWILAPGNMSANAWIPLDGMSFLVD